MRANKKIALSIIAVIACLAVIVTGVFAWFSPSGQRRSNFIMYTGDIDLEYNFYVGHDTQKDGVLEGRVGGEDVTIENPSLLSRAEYLSTFYSPVNKTFNFNDPDDRGTGINRHEQCVSGTFLTFKMVIINKPQNVADAAVSINFSNLENGYFYDYIQEYVTSAGTGDQGTLSMNETKLNAFGKNSSRILFSVTNIKAKRYSADKDANGDYLDNGFEEGYTNLTASTEEDDITAGAEEIIHDNGLTGGFNTREGLYNFWNVSKEEKFIKDLKVNHGELLEIDFQLECMQRAEIVSGYQQPEGGNEANYKKHFTESVAETQRIMKTILPSGTAEEQARIKKLAEDYVRQMINLELTYIYGEDLETAKELLFMINKIFITGLSLPSKGVAI